MIIVCSEIIPSLTNNLNTIIIKKTENKKDLYFIIGTKSEILKLLKQNYIEKIAIPIRLAEHKNE